MTETPEPASAGDPNDAEPNDSTDPKTPSQRQSLFGRLNRTNRIAAVVLSGVAAVFAAAGIFGAGVLVGSELGSESDHHVADSFDDGSAEQSGSHQSEGDEDFNGHGERDFGAESGGQGDPGEEGVTEGPPRP
jgi:hypothetical protein